MPNRHQAIAWTNDDSVGFNELSETLVVNAPNNYAAPDYTCQAGCPTDCWDHHITQIACHSPPKESLGIRSEVGGHQAPMSDKAIGVNPPFRHPH